MTAPTPEEIARIAERLPPHRRWLIAGHEIARAIGNRDRAQQYRRRRCPYLRHHLSRLVAAKLEESAGG